MATANGLKARHSLPRICASFQICSDLSLYLQVVVFYVLGIMAIPFVIDCCVAAPTSWDALGHPEPLLCGFLTRQCIARDSRGLQIIVFDQFVVQCQRSLLPFPLRLANVPT